MPEQTELTIVEGLKRLRIIEKKIESNNADVVRYASGLSNRKPVFETEERQQEEVKSLTQSSIDLVTEYLKLKRRIDLTNLQVEIEIEGETRTIAEWLIVKRKIADIMIGIYRSLSDSTATTMKRDDRFDGQGKPAHIVRYYKEEEKMKRLRHWQDLKAAIDGRLEVVNATTNLAD